jgi:tetratricopeptide (TPR) repeat protein
MASQISSNDPQTIAGPRGLDIALAILFGGALLAYSGQDYHFVKNIAVFGSGFGFLLFARSVVLPSLLPRLLLVYLLGHFASIAIFGVGSFALEYVSGATLLCLGALVVGPAMNAQGQLLHRFSSIVALAVSLYGLAQFAGVVPAGIDGYGNRDFASFMGLSNFSAEFVALLLFLMAGRAEDYKRPKVLVPAVVTLAYIVISGSHAAWLAVALGVAGIGVAKRKMQIALPGALLGIGLMISGLLEFRASDSFRLEAWAAAFRLLLDNPLGVGVGWFADAVQNLMDPEVVVRQMRTGHKLVDPHSEIVRLVVEFGVFGVLFLVVAFVAGGKALVRFVRDSQSAQDSQGSQNSENALALAGVFASAALLLVAFPLKTVGGAVAIGLCLSRLPADRKASRLVWNSSRVLLFVASVGLLLPLAQMHQAQEHIVDTQNYNRRGLIELPATSARKAAEVAGWNRQVRLMHVLMQSKIGNHDIAAKYSEKLLLEPFVDPALLRAALKAAIYTRNTLAIEVLLTKHADLIERFLPVDRLGIVMLLTNQGYNKRALSLVTEEDWKSSVDVQLLTIQAAADLGDYEMANRIVDYGLDENSPIGLWMAKVILLEKQGQFSESHRVLDELMLVNEHHELHLLRARLHWLEKNREQAYAEVKEAFRVNPTLSVDPHDAPDPVYRAIYKYVTAKLQQGL